MPLKDSAESAASEDCVSIQYCYVFIRYFIEIVGGKV